jgi:hypothetical protein
LLKKYRFSGSPKPQRTKLKIRWPESGGEERFLHRRGNRGFTGPGSFFYNAGREGNGCS